ncbi:MAG: hypothetical protein QM739_02430 [Propionivibrio sp.]
MVVLTVLTLLGLSLFIGQFSVAQHRIRGAQNTAQALAEAKEALIGDAISKSAISDAAYLRLPDLGQFPAGTPNEGFASLNFTGNTKNYSVLGKLPWKTLRTAALRDGNAECIWYVVSGRYKIDPPTDALNWDTQGQIDVIDGNGNVIAANLAALLIAPGTPQAGQDRSPSNAAYTQCAGNYSAPNYLDAHDVGNAISGEVNYFAGSINNRVATNENNKRFVTTDSAYYNDQFLYVTADDIFLTLIKRSDFSAALDNLLDNTGFVTAPISGSKGTDSFSCGADVFCKNWKEMLLLKELQPPAPITIDGVASGVCSRILFFAGRKGTGQSRNTVAEKADVNNYLEGTNASSFSIVDAPASDFSGASSFDWSAPETDLVRCLP